MKLFYSGECEFFIEVKNRLFEPVLSNLPPRTYEFSWETVYYYEYGYDSGLDLTDYEGYFYYETPHVTISTKVGFHFF